MTESNYYHINSGAELWNTHILLFLNSKKLGLFRMKESLVPHQTTVYEKNPVKPFKCEICQNSFGGKSKSAWLLLQK